MVVSPVALVSVVDAADVGGAVAPPVVATLWQFLEIWLLLCVGVAIRPLPSRLLPVEFREHKVKLDGSMRTACPVTNHRDTDTQTTCSLV